MNEWGQSASEEKDLKKIGNKMNETKTRVGQEV